MNQFNIQKKSCDINGYGKLTVTHGLRNSASVKSLA